MSLYKTKQELEDIFQKLRNNDAFYDAFNAARSTQDARTIIKDFAADYDHSLPKVSDRERLAIRFRTHWGVSHNPHPGEEKFSWWGEQFDNSTGCSQGDVPSGAVRIDETQFSAILEALDNTTKDHTMSNTITVETRTFINGVDAKSYDSASLYGLISREEAKIAELNALTNKPDRLVAEIDKRQAGIDKLVSFLNEKDAAEAAKASA